MTRQVWAEICREAGARRVYWAGLSRLSRRLELLVHKAGPADEALFPAQVEVTTATSRDELAGRAREFAARSGNDRLRALVGLGLGAAAGFAIGLVRDRETTWALEALHIRGARLPELLLSPSMEPRISPGALPATQDELWSRTIGALGASAWRRLAALRVAIVGCGRSGSLAAIGLARAGVRELALIDPDRVELHNLGETDGLTVRQVGRPKAVALRSALRRWRAETAPERGPWRLSSLAESVLSLRALPAIKRADLVVCCVDDDGARLAAAVLAKLYLKPLLDVGAAVLGPQLAVRRLGADVRLILPGECLLCAGGLNDLSGATARLLSGDLEQSPVPGGWRRQRAGSLRSLNMMAVATGLRLVEELVCGRLGSSAWVWIEFSGAGLPGLEVRIPRQAPSCPLCRYAAAGDAGIAAVQRMLPAAHG